MQHRSDRARRVRPDLVRVAHPGEQDRRKRIRERLSAYAARDRRGVVVHTRQRDNRRSGAERSDPAAGQHGSIESALSRPPRRKPIRS